MRRREVFITWIQFKVFQLSMFGQLMGEASYYEEIKFKETIFEHLSLDHSVDTLPCFDPLSFPLPLLLSLSQKSLPRPGFGR